MTSSSLKPWDIPTLPEALINHRTGNEAETDNPCGERATTTGPYTNHKVFGRVFMTFKFIDLPDFPINCPNHQSSHYATEFGDGSRQRQIIAVAVCRHGSSHNPVLRHIFFPHPASQIDGPPRSCIINMTAGKQ
ncbi:hypothetical protein Bbelb_180350 [Branchiostoma belcheri]|nr:hypothetical protein Bbelb_180350 [Branchiostoma belcheri]